MYALVLRSLFFVVKRNYGQISRERRLSRATMNGRQNTAGWRKANSERGRWLRCRGFYARLLAPASLQKHGRSNVAAVDMLESASWDPKSGVSVNLFGGFRCISGYLFGHLKP
jgi:hypothetical protein